MLTFVLGLGLLTLGAGDDGTAVASADEQVAPGIRWIDLNGDGLRDQLLTAEDGSLTVALNLSRRQFEEIRQELPAVAVSAVLAADLDGDGHTDLYLVSRRSNVALAGDGSGRFVDATRELGLADGGLGLAVERDDLDGDGLADVLLHNRAGDVAFFATEHGAHERYAPTPAIAVSARGLAPLPPVAEEPATAAPKGSRAPVATTPSPAGGRELASTPTVTDATAIPLCARAIEDRTTGDCLPADSTPTLGRLYPLGPEFNIDALTGHVGIGTLAPSQALEVAGTVRVSGFEMTTGPQTGHVLTCDATGSASWQGAPPDDDWTTSGSDIYRDTGWVTIGANIRYAPPYVSGDGTSMLGTLAVSNSLSSSITSERASGIVATTEADTGAGVFGKAYKTSGHAAGVKGLCNSSTGYAVFGSNTSGYGGYFVGQGYFSDDVGIGTNAPQARLHVTGGETILQQESWKVPSLLNGWVDYGAGYSSVGYFEDSTGIVHLRGLVKNGSGVIFTLPVGYRPAQRMVFSVISASGASRVDIATNGTVELISGSNTYASLDGIVFRAV